MFVEMSDMNLLGVLSLISYLFGVLRHERKPLLSAMAKEVFLL